MKFGTRIHDNKLEYGNKNIMQSPKCNIYARWRVIKKTFLAKPNKVWHVPI